MFLPKKCKFTCCKKVIFYSPLRENYVSMKYILLLAIITLSCLDCIAQHDPDKLFYLQKVEKYRKMKSTGTVLAISGGILAGVGFVTLLNSSITETTNGYGSTHTTTEGNPVLGAVAFLVGIGGMGSGIPLWAVGAHNQRKYTARLESLSVDFKVDPRSSGIALRYRF